MHYKHVFPPHIFFNLDERFPVGKWLDLGFADFNADVRANRVGQRAICCAAKNFHELNFVAKEKSTVVVEEKAGGI